MTNNEMRDLVKECGLDWHRGFMPLTILREMLADTREVFDANGSETPQVVRDVIEFVASWIGVYTDKSSGITGEQHGD